MKLYHGSREGRFDKFQVRPSHNTILFSQIPVVRDGHFFSTDPQEAAGFGHHVAEVEYHPTKVFVDPSKDKHLGVSRLDPTRELHLAKMVAKMIQKDQHGHFIDRGVRRYPVYPYTHPRNDSTHHLGFAYHGLDQGGLHWEVLDHPEAVKTLTRLGYDGTWVHEPETESGTSFFVPSAHSHRIQIKGWQSFRRSSR